MSTSAPSASPEIPLEQADYAAPRLECDIVMKGGITSGVVYPLAVCELAKTYRFRCIGGTSAGAIAAAATAAAELGRRNGGMDRGDGKDADHGFRELARLPAWLGGSEEGADRSHLFALFQPDGRTDALFDVATARLRGRGILGRLLTRFPGAALLGALPGLIAAAIGFGARPAAAVLVLVFGGVLLAAGGALALPAWWLARRARRDLPANGFGLCSGNGPDVDDPTGMPPALTPWLAHLLNDLAGKPRADGPVTFGDLAKAAPDGEPWVDLRFMTTNLTHGRPYEFPLGSRLFYYDPDELAAYFPDWVMRGMNEAAREIKRATAGERDRRAARRAGEVDATAAPAARGEKPDRPLDEALVAEAKARWDRLLPVPEPEDVPVVLGARLSLSFPALFSAVPLYAVDYTRVLYDDERAPERCWFSDGGICSNFPVHFFDSALPGRPTFGINLRPFPVDQAAHPTDQAKNSWLPGENSDGHGEWFTRLSEDGGWTSLAGFLGMIVTTMQNWVDNTQLRVPGYRDRVAHVLLTASEGGLNLDMPAGTIRDLGTRGRLAARELARRFDPVNVPADTPLTWDNHRWVRFRSSMQLVDELLREIRDQYRAPDPGGRTYADLVARAPGQAPTSYPLRSVKRARLVEQALADLGRLPFLNGKAPLFEKGAPRPLPELRIRPRL